MQSDQPPPGFAARSLKVVERRLPRLRVTRPTVDIVWFGLVKQSQVDCSSTTGRLLVGCMPSQ